MIQVIQVLPQDNYDVVIYFNNGVIKKYNVGHLVGKGVFKVLEDKKFYRENCTVLNHTLAWTLDGLYNPEQCIDLDPLVLYQEGVVVQDPLEVWA
ncbi:MAG: DUF2442 domain-containing protein [Treponemataceae bacterium]|nr:DUF2442 domain-containing protein [Treponemataceae bacterium]